MSLAIDILQGKHDGELDSISQAVRERQKAAQSMKTSLAMAVIQVGDRVRLKDISPKYMIGELAEVVGKKTKKVTVRLDNPNSRFKGDVTVPASCVEVYDE